MISRKNKKKDIEQSLINAASDMELILDIASAERCEQVYRSYLEARNQPEGGSLATGKHADLGTGHYFDTGFCLWCSHQQCKPAYTFKLSLRVRRTTTVMSVNNDWIVKLG